MPSLNTQPQATAKKKSLLWLWITLPTVLVIGAIVAAVVVYSSFVNDSRQREVTSQQAEAAYVSMIKETYPFISKAELGHASCGVRCGEQVADLYVTKGTSNEDLALAINTTLEYLWLKSDDPQEHIAILMFNEGEFYDPLNVEAAAATLEIDGLIVHDNSVTMSALLAQKTYGKRVSNP